MKPPQHDEPSLHCMSIVHLPMKCFDLEQNSPRFWNQTKASNKDIVQSWLFQITWYRREIRKIFGRRILSQVLWRYEKIGDVFTQCDYDLRRSIFLWGLLLSSSTVLLHSINFFQKVGQSFNHNLIPYYHETFVLENVLKKNESAVWEVVYVTLFIPKCTFLVNRSSHSVIGS